MTDLEQATQYIEEDIKIHKGWKEYLDENPNAFEAGVAGDSEHHQKWIKRLELVLKVLKDNK